jgi:type II secretory pathway pseudopilin PulG
MIELLIVVAIILILAALLSSAVFKVMGMRKTVQARTEMTQLSAAVDNFKRQFKVDYLPSRIKLCENCNLYYNPTTGQPATQLDVDSLQFLGRMFPRANFGFVGAGVPNQYDWNGDGVVSPTPWILEGDQCLVFFLGGIQVPQSAGAPFACLGFSTNPANPTAVGGDRIKPLYDFSTSFTRLAFLSHSAMDLSASGGPNYSAPFYSFLDPWGAPYLYFSSYKTTNGYNRYFGTAGVGGPAPAMSDCQSQNSPNGAWPYASFVGATQRYYREDSFQIISAGPDGKFGLGSFTAAWTPPTAGAFYPSGTAGADDLSNFYDHSLGTAGAQ